MNKKELDTAWERRLRAVGLAVAVIEGLGEKESRGGVRLNEIRFRLDADNRTNVLAILKGEGPEGKVVGFVGGLDLSTVILAVAKKVRAEAVRWREDLPYGGR